MYKGKKMETQISACSILYKSAREKAITFIQNKNNKEVIEKVLRYMNSSVSQQRKMQIQTKIKLFFLKTELVWVKSDNSVEKNANNEEIVWQPLNWRVGETAQW